MAPQLRDEHGGPAGIQGIQELNLASSTIDWSDWRELLDDLIDLNEDRAENPMAAPLTELHRGSFSTIFRIHSPER